MTVKIVKRRGKRRLVLDICWRKQDGTWARYRRDAQVQTMAGAKAEDARRLAALALTGSPELVDTVDQKASEGAHSDKPNDTSRPNQRCHRCRRWERRSRRR